MQSKASAREPSSLEMRTVVAAVGSAVVIVAAVVATHWPVLSAGALSFDDTQYLTENYRVQNPSWESARRFLAEVLTPSTVGGYYQPLAMISLMLDYAAGGRPDYLRPFHRTSLILHTVNTVLAGVLVYLLLIAAARPQPEDKDGAADAVRPRMIRAALPAAAMVSLLFGLHPMTVETIAWVGERKTTLAALFSFVCLIAYVRYAVHRRASLRGGASVAAKNRAAAAPVRDPAAEATGHPAGGHAVRRRWWFYGASLVCYVLALMSKPTSTPLPLVMLVLDWWPLRRLGRRAVAEKLPFFVVGAVSAVVTFISQSRTAAVELPGQYSPARIPLVVCHNLIFYPWKMVCPADLSSHYPFPEPFGLSSPMVLAGVLGTAVLAGGIVISLRWTRVPAAGALIFLVAVLPTMQIIGFSTVIASDKFAYLPSIGLLLALAWGLCRCWAGAAGRPWPAAVRAGIVGVVVLLGAREVRATRRYLDVWRDTERLHQHMLKLAPRAPTVHFGLGSYLAAKGRLAEAAKEFRETLRYSPNMPEAESSLGAALFALGDMNEAIPHLSAAVRMRPDDFAIRNNLGVALAAQGKHAEAIEHLTVALKVRPDAPRVRFNLGKSLAALGRHREAVAHLEAAVRIKPSFAEAHYVLAGVLVDLGRDAEAVAHYEEAIRRQPTYPEARNDFATALIRLGRLEEAVSQASEALRQRPGYAKAHYNLGLAYARQNRTSEAVAQFGEAIAAAPDFAEAYNNMAAVLLMQQRTEEALWYLSEAVRLKPDYLDAQFNFGYMLERAGRFDEAAEHYREALRLDPNHAEAGERLQAIAPKSGTSAR